MEELEEKLESKRQSSTQERQEVLVDQLSNGEDVAEETDTLR